LKGTGTDRAGGHAYTAAKRGLVGLMQTSSKPSHGWSPTRLNSSLAPR